MLEQIRTALQGRKTYIVAAIAGLTALLGWVNGDLSLIQALANVLLAIGIGGARKGITAS